jgi:hypothetical protein
MKYEQLSNEAKEKARDRYCDVNIDYGWLGSTCEYAEEVAGKLGIYGLEIKGFDLDRGSYVQYEAKFRTPMMKLETLGDELKEQLKHIIDPLVAQSALCAIHSQGSFLWASITPSHRASLNVDWEVWETDDDEELEDLLDGAAIEQAFNDFADWIQGQLQAEYDWLTSDEAIENSIIANEYEFDEEGELL